MSILWERKNKNNLYRNMTTSNNINLDDRLTPAIDYTRRDEIIFSLVNIITCPIVLEATDDMVIFNHHFYDRNAFDQHRRNEMRAS